MKEAIGFYACGKLYSVDFGDNCQMSYMPNNMFIYSKIVSIDFSNAGDQLKSTGYGTFSQCRSLTTVNLGNLTSVSEYSFSGCIKLSTITWGSKIVSIKGFAFQDCYELNSFPLGSTGDLLDSLENIGNCAFRNCRVLGKVGESGKTNIVTLLQKSKVTTIGDGAFNGCNYLEGQMDQNTKGLKNKINGDIVLGKSVFVNEAGETYVTYAVTYDPYQKNDDGTYKLDGNGNKIAVKKIGIEYKGATAFRDPDGNTIPSEAVPSLVIPEGVEEIATYAFQDCVTLTSVIWNTSLSTVPAYAFYGCSYLSSFSQSSSQIKEIGSMAFYGCSRLKECCLNTLGKSLYSIEYVHNHAFTYCSALEHVFFDNNVTIEGGALQFCAGLKTLGFRW